MSRTIIQTIYAPDRHHRVVVFQRMDGSFGFEEQHYSSIPLEECWLCGPRHSECRCSTQEELLHECVSRVSWLADSIARGRDLDGLPRPRVSGPPPHTIGGMGVVCYTPIDERHFHTGNCSQIVADKLQGPAAGLLICRCDEEDAFYLFGCDSDWVPVTDTWHKTFVEAQQQAEFEYAGVSLTWQILRAIPPS